MATVPRNIDLRVRRPVPADSCIVPGSTPVLAFGNALCATVATLGLNPSRVEFLDRDGRELVGRDRRLATHRSLGITDLSTAPQSAIAQVLDDCNEYFRRNPYWKWFGQLEQILNACGASYCDGSACHLDLVQWATDPVWSKLRPREIRQRLLDSDAEFFKEQLANENIELLLVNGRGVTKALERQFTVALTEVDRIDGLGRQPTDLSVGEIFGRVRIIAWNINLQSSFGVRNELRSELANRVAYISRA